MKSLTRVFAPLLALVLFAAACGNDDLVNEDTTSETSIESTTIAGQTAAADERIEMLWVGPQLVDCVGVGPQKCLLVRYEEDGQDEYFYDSIEGFEHVGGTTYQLKVAVSDVQNPPADGSSLSYRLLEIVESSTEPATTNLDGTSWTLLGFGEGDLYDPLPDGVEITLNFAGERVNGSAGCNNYMGTFTVDGESLTFGPLAGTKMMCQPDVMDQERRFHSVMAMVEIAGISSEGDLVLAAADRLNLFFAPVA